MVVKNHAKKTRGGKVTSAIFGGAVFLVGISGGAFFLFLWGFADADGSAEGRWVALLMAMAFFGMAALVVYALTRPSVESPDAVAERIGVPESVRDRNDDARPQANIPNVLRGHEPPGGALIVAGGSIWFSRMLLMVAVSIAAGLLYVGWNLETVIPEWHGWVDYVFIGIGALLLAAGVWPGNWRKRLLGFIAMREGIYVHGQGAYPEGHEWATPETRWLFVPWANVVDVREGLALRAGGAPPSGRAWEPSTKLSLCVTPREAREWFPHAKGEGSRDGVNRIVSLDYSESDPSPRETVPRLQRLWRHSRG